MSFIFRLHFPVKTHENKYQPSENIHPAYAGNHLVCLQVSGWGCIAGVRRITEGKNQGKEHAGKYCCFSKLHSKRVYSMEALAVETELGWGGVFNSQQRLVWRQEIKNKWRIQLVRREGLAGSLWMGQAEEWESEVEEKNVPRNCGAAELVVIYYDSKQNISTTSLNLLSRQQSPIFTIINERRRGPCDGPNDGPQKICPHRNPQSLWLWPHMAKDVIRLRILRREAYLGSFGWALNAITSVLVSEK